MINNADLIEESTVEFYVPFKDNSIQFITLKNWDGRALKLQMPFFRELLANYFRITTTDAIRRQKKLIKKVIDVNSRLKKATDFGVIYLMWEGYKGGKVFVESASAVGDGSDWNFTREGWNKLTEVLIISKEDQFSLSLRTAVEAKLLQRIQKSSKFSLLNDPKSVQEKIKLAEFQLEDLDVKVYHHRIKTILDCLNVPLL